MSATTYAVLLHGEHVGTIQRRDAETTFTVFAFDADYWDRPERRVLGRWFEDHPRERPHAVNQVPVWFSNLLPEGRLRELISHEQEVGAHQEMDLLEHVGADLPGAVEVRPHTDAADVEDGRPSTQGDTPPEATRLDFSLPGLMLKFSMRADGERLVLPSPGQEGDWIVKTPERGYPQLPANEHAMMQLARRTGIDVPDTALPPRSSLDGLDGLGPGTWPSEETEAYAVRRFDRSPAGRVHIEDFAQILGIYGVGEAKYRSNVETVLGLAWRGHDHASLQEAVRRTVFNLLIGNGDAHLKNWSLIYPDGTRARLSPAYDLVCTAVHLPEPDNRLLALPFLGATQLPDVGREHFTRLQEMLNVANEDVLDVVDSTLERFCDTWADGAPAHTPQPVVDWINAHLADTRRRLLTQR